MLYAILIIDYIDSENDSECNLSDISYFDFNEKRNETFFNATTTTEENAKNINSKIGNKEKKQTSSYISRI